MQPAAHNYALRIQNSRQIPKIKIKIKIGDPVMGTEVLSWKPPSLITGPGACIGTRPALPFKCTSQHTENGCMSSARGEEG